MVSRLINNNGGRNQNKHYKVLFQEAMFNKHSIVYASLVANIDN